MMEEVNEQNVKKGRVRRGIAICPACGAPMKICFANRSAGGYISIPGYVVCLDCMIVKKIILEDI